MRRLTIQHAHDLAASRGGSCLSAEWVGSKGFYVWKCHMGHEWNSKYNTVQQGSWCPACGHGTLSIEIACELAKSRGGFCLDTVWAGAESNYSWKCSIPDHAPWNAAYSDVKKGTWCPHCAGVFPLTIQHAYDLAIDNGGVCLDTEWSGIKHKYLWKCADTKHIAWYATFYAIKRGQWCPECSKHKREKQCRWIFVGCEEESGVRWIQ